MLTLPDTTTPTISPAQQRLDEIDAVGRATCDRAREGGVPTQELFDLIVQKLDGTADLLIEQNAPKTGAKLKDSVAALKVTWAKMLADPDPKYAEEGFRLSYLGNIGERAKEILGVVQLMAMMERGGMTGE